MCWYTTTNIQKTAFLFSGASTAKTDFFDLLIILVLFPAFVFLPLPGSPHIANCPISLFTCSLTNAGQCKHVFGAVLILQNVISSRKNNTQAFRKIKTNTTVYLWHINSHSLHYHSLTLDLLLHSSIKLKKKNTHTFSSILNQTCTYITLVYLFCNHVRPCSIT